MADVGFTDPHKQTLVQIYESFCREHAGTAAARTVVPPDAG
jgi:hypothetical protein